MNQNSILFRMMEGQQINQYHLEKLLGAGGFGGVFLATEVVRDQAVRQLAVKIIPDSSDEQLSELITASNLEHDHLVRSYSAGECHLLNTSMLYLAMELAEGSLEAQLSQSKLSSEIIKQVLQQTALGLKYLHQQKGVHRDLKPGNVLLSKGRYKVSDFGLVRGLGMQTYAKTSNPIGTIAYMPPEAFEGKITTAWDIWSLGIMAVQMVTGKLPYEFEGQTQLMKRVMNVELNLPSIPKEYGALVSGCLTKEWRQRWTVDQVLNYLLPNKSVSVSATPKSSPIVTPRYQHRNFTETLPSGIQLEMIAIPAGTFMMGSNEGDYEQPIHKVTLEAFYMGKYPITQAQYQAVMKNNPSRFKGFFGGKGDHPVESVSWNDVQEFCRKLSQMTQKTYQLPSEAQWEYACRAGSRTKWCFGDNESQLGDYAWYSGNSNDQTHSVGQKKPNQWGLYDMHGNVWEWCEDDWHDNYRGAPTDGSAWLDQQKSDTKLLRGGSWFDSLWYHRRSAYRGDLYTSVQFDHRHGFRVVCVLPRTS